MMYRAAALRNAPRVVLYVKFTTTTLVAATLEKKKTLMSYVIPVCPRFDALSHQPRLLYLLVRPLNVTNRFSYAKGSREGRGKRR